MRTTGRTIESCDSGLISRGAYNQDFTVFVNVSNSSISYENSNSKCSKLGELS